jgi:predicted flap endonuclease-1-like 5' DNA nuclease
MIFLIAQLAGPLLLTAAFAIMAGWSFAAERARPEEEARRRERDNLVRDIVALASGENGAADDGVGAEREIDAARRMGEIHIARIAELERALSVARSNADSAAAQAAELARQLEAREAEPVAAAVVEEPPAPEPSANEQAVALQAWRLRYFEQRVRYLEERGASSPPAEPHSAPPLDAWRARVATAEAAFLAEHARMLAKATPETAPEPGDTGTSPFAANAETDILLRWRMLYLERRVAHLQAQAARAPAPPMPVTLHPAGPDPERWKWRARYLEARARRLEQRIAEATPVASPSPIDGEQEETPPPAHEPLPAPEPPARSVKPAMLASPRDGAPDDLTLIDGVSQQQQSTFYSLGVFHFDQIAAWTPENVAWIDQYLRLRGRIDDEEWIEQAADLAREGPSAARRVFVDEEV